MKLEIEGKFLDLNSLISGKDQDISTLTNYPHHYVEVQTSAVRQGSGKHFK